MVVAVVVKFFGENDVVVAAVVVLRENVFIVKIKFSSFFHFFEDTFLPTPIMKP